MKQRIFALLLVVALLVTAAVVMVNAADATEATETIDYSNYSCPHCGKTGEDAGWTAMDISTQTGSSAKTIAGGHYYVTEDETFSKQLYWKTTGDVVVDLRGHNITANGCRFLYALGTKTAPSNVTIVDSGSGATVTSSYGSGGGCLYAGTYATISVYGGTYNGSDAGTVGGALYVGHSTATMNIYAPTVVNGGNVLKHSGTAYVSSGTLNIHGGTLNDGSAAKANGIGINSGTVNVYGGTVGSILPYGDTQTVTIENNAVVECFDTTLGGEATIGTLTEGASIGIKAADGADMSAYKASYDAGYVHTAERARNEGLALTVNAEGNLVGTTVNALANAMDFSNPDALPDYCPACGAENVTWTAFSQVAAKSHTTGGHYYVSQDLEGMGLQQFITNNYCLHLNGKNLTGSNRVLFFSTDGTTHRVMGSGTVTGGNMTLSNDTYIRGMAIDHDKGDLYLYGGTYTATASAYKNWNFIIADRGGTSVTNICNDVIVEPTGDYTIPCVGIAQGGTLNVYGGTIRNGIADTSSVSRGGNICLVKNASKEWDRTVNIYGGVIEGGVSRCTGGNIGIWQTNKTYGSVGTATVNIYGGTIRNGSTRDTDSSDRSGGNIGIQLGGELNMWGGTVTGGTARYHGGNIYINASTANFYGDVTGLDLTVSNGTAVKGSGGNIYATSSEVNIVKGTVTGGAADKVTNIYTTATDLTLNGLQITDNAALAGTEKFAVRTDGGTLTLTGATKVNNNGSGGNVYLSSTTDLTVDKSFTGNVKLAMHGNHVPDPFYGNPLAQDEDDVVDSCNGAFEGKLYLDDYRSAGHYYGSPTITSQYTSANKDTKLYVQGDVILLVNKDTKEAQLYAGETRVDDMLAVYDPTVHYIRIGTVDEQIDLPADEHHIIDTNGYPVTVTCTNGTATVSGLDSNNATTTNSANGSLYVADSNVTVTDELKHKAIDGKTYYMLHNPNTSTYTYHYVTLKLKNVSLRTSQVGIYYTAEIKADSRFCAAIEEYGVVVSLDEAPTKNFTEQNYTGWSCFDTTEYPLDPKGNDVYGTMVKGIMKTEAQAEGRIAEQNQANGERQIHAAAYIILKDTYGSETVLSETCNYSLHTMLQALDNVLAEDTTHKAALDEFYNTWKEFGMGNWDFTYIGKETTTEA